MGTIEPYIRRNLAARRTLLAAATAAWAVLLVLVSAAYFSARAVHGPSFRSALSGPLRILNELDGGAMLFFWGLFAVSAFLVGWGVWRNGLVRVVLGAILGSLLWLALLFFFAFLHNFV